MFIELSKDELLSGLFDKKRIIYINNELAFVEETMIEIYAGEAKIGKIEVEEYYEDINDSRLLVSSQTLAYESPELIRYADDSLDGDISSLELPDDGRGWLFIYNKIQTLVDVNQCKDVSTKIVVVYDS